MILANPFYVTLALCPCLGNSEFYSVVLLTDDRNLRVKAHASGLPVRDIPAFMRLVPPAKKL